MGKKAKHRIDSIVTYADLFENVIIMLKNISSEFKEYVHRFNEAVGDYTVSEESQSATKLKTVNKRAENVRDEIEVFFKNVTESFRLCSELQKALEAANKFFNEKNSKLLVRFKSKEAVSNAIKQGHEKFKELHDRLDPFYKNKAFFKSIETAQESIEPYLSSQDAKKLSKMIKAYKTHENHGLAL